MAKIYRTPLWVSLTFLVFLSISAYVFGETHTWVTYSTDGDIGHFFCEHSRMNNLVREPVNTLTNIPFLFMGLLIFKIGKRDKERDYTLPNLMMGYPVYSILFGASCLFLFFGSTFFHSSLIMPAQQLDMSGVYALILFPFYYNLHRAYNLVFF